MGTILCYEYTNAFSVAMSSKIVSKLTNDTFPLTESCSNAVYTRLSEMHVDCSYTSEVRPTASAPGARDKYAA